MSAIAIEADGFVVDAEVLGTAFDLDPATVPERMRVGQITSRCEAGEGEDAGRWRLTFYYADRALRLIADAQGTVLSRQTFPAHPPRPREGLT